MRKLLNIGNFYCNYIAFYSAETTAVGKQVLDKVADLLIKVTEEYDHSSGKGSSWTFNGAIQQLCRTHLPSRASPACFMFDPYLYTPSGHHICNFYKIQKYICSKSKLIVFLWSLQKPHNPSFYLRNDLPTFIKYISYYSYIRVFRISKASHFQYGRHTQNTVTELQGSAMLLRFSHYHNNVG